MGAALRSVRLKQGSPVSFASKRQGVAKTDPWGWRDGSVSDQVLPGKREDLSVNPQNPDKSQEELCMCAALVLG